MLTPIQPVMQDDTAHQLQAGVAVRCSIGSTKLEVKRSGDVAYFHIELEPKSLPICRPALVGHSTVVTVDLPTQTSVWQALQCMQEMRDVMDTSKSCELQVMLQSTVPPHSQIKYLVAAYKPRTDEDDVEIRKFGKYFLGFMQDVCDLQQKRGKDTMAAIASMSTQKHTELPSTAAGTIRPPVDADMALADSGPDSSPEPPRVEAGPVLWEVTNTTRTRTDKRKRSQAKADQLQAATESPRVETGPLSEVTNALGNRMSKRKRSLLKRKQSKLPGLLQWLEEG